MQSADALQLISVIFAAICMAVLLFGLWVGRFKSLSVSKFADGPVTAPAFLFEGHQLIDATSPARELISRGAKGLPEFDRLLDVLRGSFPDLAKNIADLPSRGHARVQSTDDDTIFVSLNRYDQTLRIVLEGADNFELFQRYKAIEQEAFARETETLRFLCENAPQLIWQENENGQIVWANQSYLNYSDKLNPETEATGQAWPSFRLFEDILYPIPADATPLTKRRSIQLHGENAEHWFDVTSMPGPLGGLHFAVDANDVKRAEESQKAFMATIANTFAQLSIGLAIFDRKRRLASYNPAFGELTRLPPGFLIGRPPIEVVLDRLRDLGRLPEPKNYIDFRDQFSALEDEAQSGSYVENWDMPDGQTYRVTGRPHPDGALAFLFEDITAEITLTRRFRREIEIGQAVLDNVTEAIAVFSTSQNLIMSNQAYAELWGDSSGSLKNKQDLRSALRQWKSSCIANGVWRGIESVAHSRNQKSCLFEPITLLDGRHFHCSVIPMTGGMTMVKFEQAKGMTPTLHKLQQEDPALTSRKG